MKISIRYLRHFFVGFVSLLLMGASFNFLIDPFDIFGMPRIERFNDIKATTAVIRFVKPLQVMERRPQVVILGSSRVQVGLDPNHIGAGSAYNFGIPGVTAKELSAYGEHLLSVDSVESLILGLDFLIFNDKRKSRGAFDGDALGKYARIRALPTTLFSSQALNLSRKTIHLSFKGKKRKWRSDGLWLMTQPPGNPEKVILRTISESLSPNGSFDGFQSMERSVSEIEGLFKAVAARNVKMKVLIAPAHAALPEALSVMGLWPQYEDWKRRLSVLAARYNVNLWDFSGYTPLTTVRLVDALGTFIDASHFRPEVGRRLIDAMNGPNADLTLGRRITPENIEAHLLAQRQARDKYRSAYPNDISLIHSTAKSAWNKRR